MPDKRITLDQLSRHFAGMADVAEGVWAVRVFWQEDMLYHLNSVDSETTMDLGAVSQTVEAITRGARVDCMLCGQALSLPAVRAVVVLRPGYDSLVAAVNVRRPGATTHVLCTPCCTADALKSRMMMYLRDNLFDGDAREIDFVHRPGHG